MPPPKRSYHLIIADKECEIEWPTYTFRDQDPGFNATLETCTHHWQPRACGPGGLPAAPAKGLSGRTQRYRKRHVSERTLAAAQAVIKQFVIHLDGCADALMCWNVLHNERGLSCHFILDNDGTLYQTLDLIDCGYHAAGLNETSIGIEICNRGDAKKYPTYYDRPGAIKRDVVTCTINGHKYAAFEYTKPQYAAMDALGKALAKHLPGIKQHYPQSSPGEAHWGTLYPDDVTGAQLRSSFSGYIGHYHITRNKWDPGPFDFKKYLTKQAGRRSFPMSLSGAPRAELPEAPPLANTDERTTYLGVFDRYYDNNELGPGGFFPVGPLDDHQLYHGGIHLHAAKGTNVVAPIEGKVVLARNGQINQDIGSTNFVLLQHNIKAGAETLNFWTLLFHLDEEKAGAKKTQRPKWMMSDGWDLAEAGKYHVLDPPEPVQAGDVIGRVGVAGPDGGRAQLHFEIFTVDHGPVERLDARGFWKVYSGAADQRYCTNAEILGKIETRKDGIITQEELFEHFHGDLETRLWTRQAVTSHYSEWSEKPDWILALQDAPHARRKPRRPREIEELYQNQILPTIWWRDDVAQKLKLPSEARVFTYHPVSFLRWLNDLIGTRQADATRKATAKDILEATGDAKLDIDDTDGTSFLHEAELVYTPPEKQLQLRELIDGYGD
jgi:murein DD-endopeptidase MepM/ murein hydrolase activator NlpD